MIRCNFAIETELENPSYYKLVLSNWLNDFFASIFKVWFFTNISCCCVILAFIVFLRFSGKVPRSACACSYRGMIFCACLQSLAKCLSLIHLHAYVVVYWLLPHICTQPEYHIWLLCRHPFVALLHNALAPFGIDDDSIDYHLMDRSTHFHILRC